jgi:hypothetical protein
MKTKKLIFGFLILGNLFLSSCASIFEEEKQVLLKNDDKKDLLSSFEIKHDDANKYKEEAEGAPKPEAQPVVVENAKPTKKGKKKATDKAEKEKVPATQVVIKAIEKGIVYPSDYPADLKEFDVKSKSIWEKFKPVFYKGEQSIMSISYLGVTAGYITILSKGITKLGDKEAFSYYARFKSKDAYRYFYWLDDYIETYLDKNNFMPIKYSLVQREKKQNVDDLQLFDPKKFKTFAWYKRVKEGANKEEKTETYIPYYVQDSFSALMFTRGLPLQKGDIYEFPVVTRGKAWLLRSEVVGEEMITVMDKEVNAIKIKAETHFPGVLQKSGDILFWYSADETRKLLKFQAKVKLGSIFGEMVEYRPGVLVK